MQGALLAKFRDAIMEHKSDSSIFLDKGSSLKEHTEVSNRLKEEND